jgi:hypothetical protein
MRSWQQSPSSRTTSTPHAPTATYSCTPERLDVFVARTISSLPPPHAPPNARCSQQTPLDSSTSQASPSSPCQPELEATRAAGEEARADQAIISTTLRILPGARTRKPRPPSSGPGFTRRTYGGDGGNRTHVRDRVRMASTSVAGALISSLTRLAGGVVRDQSPEIPRIGGDGPHRVSLLSDPGLPRRRQAGPETSLA